VAVTVEAAAHEGVTSKLAIVTPVKNEVPDKARFIVPLDRIVAGIVNDTDTTVDRALTTSPK